MSDILQALESSRLAMRSGRAVMRLQSRRLRKQRRLVVALSVASTFQSIALAVMLLTSCNVYGPPSEPIEIAPTCEIAIDYVHHKTETIGDCDAGVE